MFHCCSTLWHFQSWSLSICLWIRLKWLETSKWGNTLPYDNFIPSNSHNALRESKIESKNYSMPFNLGFHSKHILNPWRMHFNPVKVSLKGFAILFKILLAHCVLCPEYGAILRYFDMNFPLEHLETFHWTSGHLAWFINLFLTQTFSWKVHP